MPQLSPLNRTVIFMLLGRCLSFESYVFSSPVIYFWHFPLYGIFIHFLSSLVYLTHCVCGSDTFPYVTIILLYLSGLVYIHPLLSTVLFLCGIFVHFWIPYFCFCTLSVYGFGKVPCHMINPFLLVRLFDAQLLSFWVRYYTVEAVVSIICMSLFSGIFCIALFRMLGYPWCIYFHAFCLFFCKSLFPLYLLLSIFLCVCWQPS